MGVLHRRHHRPAGAGRDDVRPGAACGRRWPAYCATTPAAIVDGIVGELDAFSSGHGAGRRSDVAGGGIRLVHGRGKQRCMTPSVCVCMQKALARFAPYFYVAAADRRGPGVCAAWRAEAVRLSWRAGRGVELATRAGRHHRIRRRHHDRAGAVHQPGGVPRERRDGVGVFPAHAPRGFWPIQNGGELAVLYCFIFLYLVGAWIRQAEHRFDPEVRRRLTVYFRNDRHSFRELNMSRRLLSALFPFSPFCPSLNQPSRKSIPASSLAASPTTAARCCPV